MEIVTTGPDPQLQPITQLGIGFYPPQHSGVQLQVGAEVVNFIKPPRL